MTTKAPKAFSENDPSVFLEQASAVADLIGCVNQGQCADETINSAGLLIWNLLDAAREQIAAENAERREKLARAAA